MTDPLHQMLLRHAVEIAECPTEHAMAVAEAHHKESLSAFTASLRVYLGVTHAQVNEWLAELGGISHV